MCCLPGGTTIPKQETRFGSKVVCNNIFPRLHSPSTETAVDYLEEARTVKKSQFSEEWLRRIATKTTVTMMLTASWNRRLLPSRPHGHLMNTSLLTKGNSESKKKSFLSRTCENPSIHLPRTPQYKTCVGLWGPPEQKAEHSNTDEKRKRATMMGFYDRNFLSKTTTNRFDYRWL